LNDSIVRQGVEGVWGRDFGDVRRVFPMPEIITIFMQTGAMGYYLFDYPLPRTTIKDWAPIRINTVSTKSNINYDFFIFKKMKEKVRTQCFQAERRSQCGIVGEFVAGRVLTDCPRQHLVASAWYQGKQKCTAEMQNYINKYFSI
jgi:hypothetical protein